MRTVAARRVLLRLQRSVVNPVVMLAWDLGLPIPGDALLETTNPRVRVKVSGAHAGWRAGTASILDNDDPAERQRFLSQASLSRRLCFPSPSSPPDTA
ncbi:MAG: hypothetical protein ACRDN0_05515 [Trebonia sp.]